MICWIDAAAIADHWQREIDESLEAGTAAHLALGVGNRTLDQINALVALQRLAVLRTDITAPWLYGGGDAVSWVVTLLTVERAAYQTPTTPAATKPATVHSATIVPLYGGADYATYLAGFATLPSAAHQLDQLQSSHLSAGVESMLQPTRQTGTALPWAMLPFLILDRAPTTGSVSQSSDLVDPDTPLAEPDSPAVTDDPWVVWATFIVVISLFISALFI